MKSWNEVEKDCNCKANDLGLQIANKLELVAAGITMGPDLLLQCFEQSSLYKTYRSMSITALALDVANVVFDKNFERVLGSVSALTSHLSDMAQLMDQDRPKQNSPYKRPLENALNVKLATLEGIRENVADLGIDTTSFMPFIVAAISSTYNLKAETVKLLNDLVSTPVPSRGNNYPSGIRPNDDFSLQ